MESFQEDTESADKPAMVESTSASANDNERSLSQSLNQLSINTTSGKMSSPTLPSSSPSRVLPRKTSPASPSLNGRNAPRSPLHKSPSSTNLEARSSTPTLLKKASMNSLHGIGGGSSPRQSTSRRPSLAHTSALGPDDEVAAPEPLSAASIANVHFKTELESHHQAQGSLANDTVVILHDSCYGHRFSRPRTSRASLSTIVERPERIHASILGISTAYVRLGKRHSEGEHMPHPKHNAAELPSIPFRIQKSSRSLPLGSAAVTNVHGTKWMEELKLMCESAESRLAANGKELTRPEMTRSPDQGVPAKFHEGDLYLCSESLNAMQGALGAVCDGVDTVFEGSQSGKGPYRTFVAIRPPGHHCSASYPSGFCWLNNVHVGISHAALAHGLTHAAIIDFDLHHGDGSQMVAWEHNARAINAPKNAAPWKKTSIGYFSLHDINSYPCEMGDEEKVKNASLCIENAHGQSIWNVHLQPWKSEKEFWELYETKYSILLEKTRNYLRTQTQKFRSLSPHVVPKGAIFLSAGFDASEWESAGMQRHKVNVPTEFYARLTQDVMKIASEEDTSVNGRIISVLEGGYSDRALASGVLSHVSGLAGMEIRTNITNGEASGLNHEMSQKSGTTTPNDTAMLDIKNTNSIDPEWWAISQLDRLDAVVNPPQLAAEPKKPKATSGPSYFVPTQSFTAKIVTSPRIQRAPSGLNNGSPKAISRAASPPPPEVDWATASHELSKLLIPTDRQTKSCGPEDLSAEATRARRDRQSILTLLTNQEAVPIAAQMSRMGLRERKAPKLEEETKEPITRAARRRTVAGAAVLANTKDSSRSSTPKLDPGYALPTKQSSRRLSLASNAESTITERAGSPAIIHSRVPSNGVSNLPNRPDSSQSVRPGSVLSSRGAVAPIVVKKPRNVSQAKVAAPKTSRPKKPSVSRVPSSQIKSSSNGSSTTSSVIGSTTQKDAPSAASSRANGASDVDVLTSSMKNVRISLVTKAQKQAKEKALREADTAKSMAPKDNYNLPAALSTSAATDNAAPIKSEAQTGAIGRAPVAQMVPLTPVVDSPQHPAPTPQRYSTSQTSLQRNDQVAADIPLPASSPAMANRFAPPSSSPSATTPISPAVTPDVFIAYQPEGPTPTSSSAQSDELQPLHWLPPNVTNTPSPLKRGGSSHASPLRLPFPLGQDL